MVEFPLPDHVSPTNYFTYELGYMQNPAYSQELQGFDIQVLDSASPDTVLYSNDEVSVQVKAGLITDQDLHTESDQVAAQTKFTFKFTVSNPVPAGGYININFPLSNFEVPGSERDSRLSVNGGLWFTPS